MRALDSIRRTIAAYDAEFGGGKALADMAFGLAVALLLLVVGAGVALLGDMVTGVPS